MALVMVLMKWHTHGAKALFFMKKLEETEAGLEWKKLSRERREQTIV